MNRFKRTTARHAGLLGSLSALLLGSGLGFTIVGGVYAAMDQEARGRAFWEAGTNCLLAGCGTLVLAAKADKWDRQLNRRRPDWRSI